MAYFDSKGDIRLSKPTHFFDLPQEVRDIVYAHFPYLASIHINQDPSILVQPNVSKVCRRLRGESLNVFYGRNKFVLDLRGWKHGSYPLRWTPFEVFKHWITTIGDHNARRIRNLTFFSHNFRLNVRVSNDVTPSMTLRLRTNPGSSEVVDYVPSWYTFAVAAQRVEKGLREIVGRILAKSQKNGLTSSDFLAISKGVEDIQPFLCRRMSLGYQGTALLDDDMPMSAWPDTAAHRDKCDDCGYHRCTRGYE